MTVYLVCYDLHKPNRDYDKIIEALEEIYECERLTESCWLIKSYSSATEIRDCLENFKDKNDSLAVIEVGSKWATNYINSSANNWLKSHLG